MLNNRCGKRPKREHQVGCLYYNMAKEQTVGDWKNRIEQLLRKHPEGLSIGDFARIIGTSRHTVSLALAELKGEGRIEVRKVGSAKLQYLKSGGGKNTSENTPDVHMDAGGAD